MLAGRPSHRRDSFASQVSAVSVRTTASQCSVTSNRGSVTFAEASATVGPAALPVSVVKITGAVQSRWHCTQLATPSAVLQSTRRVQLSQPSWLHWTL